MLPKCQQEVPKWQKEQQFSQKIAVSPAVVLG
jgi:hypothetical protein